MKKLLFLTGIILLLAGCASTPVRYRLEVLAGEEGAFRYRLDGKELDRPSLEKQLAGCDDGVVEIEAPAEAPFEVVISLLEFIPEARLLTPVPEPEGRK